MDTVEPDLRLSKLTHAVPSTTILKTVGSLPDKSGAQTMIELVASMGLVVVGMVASAAIYGLGVRRMRPSAAKTEVLRWSLILSLFLCSFFGMAPFLVGRAEWVLLFPFAGLGISLFSLQRLVDHIRHLENQSLAECQNMDG